jgi:uncharacterized Rmd1/YagE family protein
MPTQVQEDPLPENEMEVDEFQYNFSASEKPHVQVRVCGRQLCRGVSDGAL